MTSLSDDIGIAVTSHRVSSAPGPVIGSTSITIDADVIDAAWRAMSENSWRALRADIRVFANWCATSQLTVVPASPSSVAAFLRDQAARGKKAATLGRYASSIARLHALADHENPTRAEIVRLELRAQRRALSVRQRQARGLRFRGEVADPLLATGPIGVCVEAMLAAATEGLPALRNAALLSLAYDTGLRRSELVAICSFHIERGSADGGRLFVPRSKTDQEGGGAYAYLSARTMKAINAWRSQASLDDGFIFRRLHHTRTRNGDNKWTVGATLSAQSVTLIYRVMLNAARSSGMLGMVDAADFDQWRIGLTAHSTRVGLTQDLFANGQDLAGIMHALRWKSAAQPARYAAALSVEANAAAKVVGRM